MVKTGRCNYEYYRQYRYRTGSAKQINECFRKIVQDRESLSINKSDTFISRSIQLESAVPPSKISALSSGEFLGMVADDPDNKIGLKTFNCEILNVDMYDFHFRLITQILSKAMRRKSGARQNGK